MDFNAKRAFLESSPTNRRTNKPKGYIFMVTIKSHADVFRRKRQLEDCLTVLKERVKGGDWSTPSYELDSLFRLHMHILCYVNKKPYFKKICKDTVWQIHFQEIDNPMGAMNYMMKSRGYDPQVQEEYELISYCHFHKLFSDTTKHV